MATKLTADKLAARYAKTTEALNGIDARKAKAEKTLSGIEGEREELSLKRDLIRVQYLTAGGDLADLGTAEAEAVESVEADEDDEVEDDEDAFGDDEV